jgi:hypothetical protein
VDPRSPCQLEAQAGRLRDGRGEAAREVRWLEDDDAHPGPPPERRQPPEPITNAAGLRACRQIDHEQVDGPAREQRAGDRETLVEVRRRDDDEPLWPNAAGDGFDRIERPGEVEPGDDRATRLGFGDMPQGQRRAAARGVTPEGCERAARNATLAEDRVERFEAGRVDAPELPFERARMICRFGRHLERLRRDRKRPDDLCGQPRRRRSPARAEVCECGGHGRCRRRHVGQIRTNVLLLQGPRPALGHAPQLAVPRGGTW